MAPLIWTVLLLVAATTATFATGSAACAIACRHRAGIHKPE